MKKVEEVMVDPEIPAEAEEVLETGKKEVNKTMHQVEEMRKFDKRLDQVGGEIDEKLKLFMPNWRFKMHIFINTSIIVIVSTLLFALYFHYVYETDRPDSFERWADELKKVGVILDVNGQPFRDCTPRQYDKEISPDVILMFRNPVHGADSSLPPAALERFLVRNGPADEEGVFRNFKKMINDHKVQPKKSVFERLPGMSPFGGQIEISRQAVGAALLQDLYKLIPTLGFDELIFSSIDEDELFLCVSLKQPSTMEDYLQRDHLTLQMRKDVVQKLGIDQPVEDPASKPPCVAYNPKMVRRLAKSGLLSTAEDKEFYEFTWNRTGPSIIGSAERIRIIFRELGLHFNLDSAVDDGLMLSWYPVHHVDRCVELKATWSGWRHLKDLSFVQPLPHIHAYFGASMAFMFGWTGVYCKTLLPLAFIALFYEIVMRGGEALGFLSFSSNQVIGFTIVLMMWSKIASNLWDREEAFFLRSWNLEDGEAADRHVRSEFEGELLPSPADANLMEKQYPNYLYNMRSLAANVFVLVFCGFVMAFMFSWMSLFHGQMNLASSILLSINIKVFELIFANLVVKLTDFENHKFQYRYVNSYLRKYFVFQFVNNYSAFFFLSSNPHGGPGKESLFNLRKQLACAVIVLSLCSIVEVVLSAVLVEFSLWNEHRLMRNAGKAPLWRSSAESQGKYSEFKVRESIDMMLPLVLSLGHMLLFGAIAPVIIPFCLVVFALHLRASAYMRTHTSKRAFPHRAHGIGDWKMIVQFLMAVGVLYSAFLFVFYGETFAGSGVLAKLTGILLFCLGISIVWALVGIFWPAHDHAVGLLQDRRQRVLDRLFVENYTNVRGNTTPRGSMRAGGGSEDSIDGMPGAKPRLASEVAAGSWEKIPPLEQFAELTETY